MSDMTNTAEPSPAEIAKRLKWLREFLGLSQTEISNSIGVKSTQWNNWETAHNRLSLQGALKIGQVYGVSLDFLFLGRSETLPHTMRSDWISKARV